MSDAENWNDIPGYEGVYQVSDKGSVRRIAAYHHIPALHVLAQRTNRSGYRVVNLNSKKTCTVHRLMARSFFGESELHVNHKNGIKTDNRLDNLEYVTRSQNAQHALYELGTQKQLPRGEANSAAILNEQQVREIRELSAVGATRAELAKTFGVSESNVRMIVFRETWKHVE